MVSVDTRSFWLHAKQMICLNMIVKNESHCIRRCLYSVLPYIDRAVIVDTGSTDDTQDIIADVLRDIKHSVIQRPWKDFGFNRTQAMEEARRFMKYRGSALLLDADEEFIPSPNFVMTQFPAGPVRDVRQVEYLWHRVPSGQYRRPFMLPLNHSWSWEGVLHECLREQHVRILTEGAYIKDHFDSHRNKQGAKAKYLADVGLLLTQPLTPRNLFYIAESYRWAGLYPESLRWHEKRFKEKHGSKEEQWWSALMIAQLKEYLAHPDEDVMRSYVVACNTRPSRAEAFVELSKFLWKTGRHGSSREVFSKAMRLPMTKDSLNVRPECYYENLRSTVLHRQQTP